MKPLSLSLCFAVMVVLFHGINGANQIIGDTCKNAAELALTYEFCVASLEADPRSSTADLQELGVISIELCLANATSIKSDIENLLNTQKWDFAMKNSLEGCLGEYTRVIPDINKAIDSFKSKNYDNANLLMSGIHDTHYFCEDSFAKKPTPLTNQNHIFDALTRIALHITGSGRPLYVQ